MVSPLLERTTTSAKLRGRRFEIKCELQIIVSAPLLTVTVGPIIMFDNSEGDEMEESTRAVNPASALTEYVAHVARRKSEWAALQEISPDTESRLD